uniref:InlB B-repeat-containing protein n=1 Tax=Faecalibacterium prausnitzii TaxID=853 RepID=UPI004029D52D
MGTFGYCRNLSEVKLPASLKAIQSYVFGGCSGLKTVSYDGSLEQWNHITTNNDVLGYSCPSLVTDDYTAQFILVENDLPDHFPKTVTITKYAGTESTVILPSTISNWPVTKIGEDAFQDNTTITSVTIPDSVTEIGKLTAPTVEGYTFDGWYADAAHTTEFDFSTPITGDTTIYAKWTANDYYVSFFTEHGDPPTSQNVKYNGTATDPGTLSEEGYTFDGWYTDDNYSKKFDFTKPITSNTTVYAKWTAKDYEVSFVTEHGDAPTSQNVKYNGTANDPGKLSEDGYTFGGWYTDETYKTKFDFSTPITGDTKVYAKWEKNAPVLPDTYALNVSGAFVYVDGVDVTAPAGDTSLPLEKDASVRLVADPDRMPSGMVFDRWTILNGALNADDAEKFETGRTLEEFAFTMPAEPLSIEATPRMQEEEGSDTASVIAGVTLGTAATALVAWQAYDLGMSLYQEHWLPADFVMPKTRAELALLLWNTAGRPAPAAQPAFADITDPDTAQAAQWAVETGLMTPKSADRFKPEKSVTRWKAVRSWKRVTNQNT